MAVEIKIPSVGESVKEAVLAQWYKEDGDSVDAEEPLFALETDKVTLEVTAEAAGVLHIQVAEGETVSVGAVVGTIDTDAASPAKAPAEADEPSETEKAPEKKEPAEPKPEPAPKKAEPAEARKPAEPKPTPSDGTEPVYPPSVRRLMAERGIDPEQVSGTGPGGRVTKGDVIAYLERRPAAAPGEAPKTAAETSPPAEDEPEERKPMTPIRKRIAARLLEARRNTAMLTTFNDVDMSRIMALRSEYKEAFKKKHEISLGMMSFFIKASVEALKAFPAINAYIDGDEIVYHHYYHIGVAVGSDRGLVVPVIRHADRLGFAGIESAIIDYVNKIKENRLELADLEGGTFTITNGGVFGSMLSTPILNTPQSGILGMHRIDKRPVVIDDEIVVRPMMYIALSYDHRIVDGREAVTFLRRIKECVENPERIMLEM